MFYIFQKIKNIKEIEVNSDGEVIEVSNEGKKTNSQNPQLVAQTVGRSEKSLVEILGTSVADEGEMLI